MTSERQSCGLQIRLVVALTLLEHMGFVRATLTNEIVGNLNLRVCPEDFCPAPLGFTEAMQQGLRPVVAAWTSDSTTSFQLNMPATTDYGRVNRTVFSVRQQCIKHSNGDFTCSLCENYCPMFVNFEYQSLPMIAVRYSTSNDNGILINQYRPTPIGRARVFLAYGDMQFSTPNRFRLTCRGDRACLEDQLEISAIAYTCESYRS